MTSHRAADGTNSHATIRRQTFGRRNSEESQNILTTESHNIFADISPTKKPLVGSPDLTSSTRKQFDFNLLSAQSTG